MIEDSQMAEHLAGIHKGSTSSDIASATRLAQHRCAFCSAVLPTPEELKAHHANQHQR
jgi:hypothetical protein